MTFIASVTARNGVAVIADSLVTTVQPVIEYEEFEKFIKEKSIKAVNGKISLDYTEVVNLFNEKPHHTKDFEEKLFQFDNYTAVTTAGSALINKKRITEIIDEIKVINAKNKRSYSNKKIETKIKDFCQQIKNDVVQHLNDNPLIGTTTFLFTHFNHIKNITEIYKVHIQESTKDNLKDINYKLVTYAKTNNFEKVVCGGQNRISERILFGDFPLLNTLLPKILKKMTKDFKIKEENIPKDYLQKFIFDSDIITQSMLSDMKIFKLTELSLQQAVDLATLLMRLEIDFQNYTENIPTVGGVIKLAVIDKDGFKPISGYDITKPNNI